MVSPRRVNVLPSRPLNTDGLPLRCGSGGGVRTGPGETMGRGRVVPDSVDGRRPGTFGRDGVRGGMRPCE